MFFSGAKGDYTERCLPDEKSYYGRTRALGEFDNQKNLTIRTSVIGPEIKSNGVGLLHWFLSQDGEVNGYSKVFWTGVTTLEMAKFFILHYS